MNTSRSQRPNPCGLLVALLLAATPAMGQNTNQITVVSPASAVQGTSNLLVTFTLDTDSPPAPPAGVLPTSVTLGSISGTSLTHSSQYTVTAVFTISGAETTGVKDAAISFSTPNGTVTFSKTSAFQVTAGSGVSAGYTATPTSGTAPLTVAFTDASTGTITSRSWDFGDGGTSTAANPSHTYTGTGSYTVSLTVSEAAGSNTLTRAGYITVTAAGAVGGYTVVDTGQTSCYNNTTSITAPAAGQSFYGQDAQCAGVQPSYAVSGDGLTVYDNRTGLTWQRSPDTNGDGSITASDKLNWTNAQARPAVLNAAHYGGYSDWRLPTIRELYSLMDFRGTDPSGLSGSDTSGLTPFINTTYFQFAYGQTSAGERIIDSQYASSTLYVSTAFEQDLFGVNFADGRIKGYGLTLNGSDKTFFVQCVRGNPSYGINLFVDNGDLTITDRATGLMWSKYDSGGGMNWQDALAWAQTKNAANFLGHNDWRLPNAKELQSIVDYTRSPDTTNSAAIDPVFNCTAITNEKGVTDYPWFWTGTTHASYNGSASSAAYVCFGRALGYMNSTWVDIHGAGCQRSDPKSGSLSSYTYTAYGYYNSIAPQGDAIRMLNYVRLVRDAGTAPAASFTGTPTTGGAPLVVTFTDTSTGAISSRHWDFGDGTTLDTTATGTSHTYSLPGSYAVSLTVSGTMGANTKSQTGFVTATSVDSVGDGVPDWWRAWYFGGNGRTTTADSVATADPDHDGRDNGHEYLADTNPTNATSYFHVEKVAGSGFTLRYQSSAGRKYTLYGSTDLSVWTAVPSQTNIPGSGGVDSLSDPAPAGARHYYRVGVQLP